MRAYINEHTKTNLQHERVHKLRSRRCTCMVWLRIYFRFPIFLILSGLKDHPKRQNLCRVKVAATNTPLECLHAAATLVGTHIYHARPIFHFVTSCLPSPLAPLGRIREEGTPRRHVVCASFPFPWRPRSRLEERR